MIIIFFFTILIIKPSYFLPRLEIECLTISIVEIWLSMADNVYCLLSFFLRNIMNSNRILWMYVIRSVTGDCVRMTDITKYFFFYCNLFFSSILILVYFLWTNSEMIMVEFQGWDVIYKEAEIVQCILLGRKLKFWTCPFHCVWFT